MAVSALELPEPEREFRKRCSMTTAQTKAATPISPRTEPRCREIGLPA
ncbi:MAG: hypothetical protein AAB418_03010 [candidate division NC10 bacterium]|jgi:hypothetical protein